MKDSGFPLSLSLAFSRKFKIGSALPYGRETFYLLNGQWHILLLKNRGDFKVILVVG